MQLRLLGKTSLRVSPIAFGAGPVAALMTGTDRPRQRQVVERAIAGGVNWFDTAPTYGDGASETHLGAVLAELRAAKRVHIATKVRVPAPPSGDLRAIVEQTVRGSLARLRVERVTLLQLHNAVTDRSGDEPASVTPGEVLSPGGILDALEHMGRLGLCQYLGLTGIGSPRALAEVLASGAFATIQTPVSLVVPYENSRASSTTPAAESDDLLATCRRLGVGVFAIRVFAGGALSGQEPSEHTKRTPFFPLAVFERDRRRAERMDAALPPGMSLTEAAVRYVVGHAAVDSAIIGMGSVDQLDEVLRFAERGPLSNDMTGALMSVAAAEESS